MNTNAAKAFVCASHSPMMTRPGLTSLGEGFRTSLQAARDFIHAFGPDLVVFFAPDHLNLLEHVRPPFTIVLRGSTLPEFGVAETELDIDLDAAASVCTGTQARGFDVAAAEDVAIDHGLGMTLGHLFQDPQSVRLIPIIINSISFPLVPMRRSIEFGNAVGESLGEDCGRVLYIASGGLSHDPPFPPPVPGAKKLDQSERLAMASTAADRIDEVWDREFLKSMADGDVSWLLTQSQADIDRRGGGANELRVWAAAWAAAGLPPAQSVFYEPVPAWITGMGVAFGAN